MTPTTGARRAALAAGLACLGLATAGLGAGTGRARAVAAPGSGLLSYSLAATAPGAQYTEDRLLASSHPEFEGEAPESIAQLQTGGQGYALATVAWPGPLVANAGSTSQLLNLGLPSSVSDNLNEPIRAESRTGTGAPTVTNDSYPGAIMTASTSGDAVRADATIAGTNGPLPHSGAGNTETSSQSRLSGVSTGVATAASTVQNVNLGGGVVTIGTVTSTATATTDGSQATASGHTTIGDLRIGGQPAYLDDTGLHLGSSGPGVPVNATASQIANQALTSIGMKIALSLPATARQAGGVRFDAGNVVFFWSPPGSGGETVTATFGGASVSVGATPGFASPSAPGPAPLAGPAVSVTPPVPDAAAPSPAVEPPAAVPTTTAPVAGPSAPFAPRAAPAAFHLPHGLSPAFPVLVLCGAVLIGIGLRRLPDRMLEDASTACPLGDQP